VTLDGFGFEPVQQRGNCAGRRPRGGRRRPRQEGTLKRHPGTLTRPFRRQHPISRGRSTLPGRRGRLGEAGKAILEQVDASLRRLDTDYIDLYQIHRFDPETPVAETMRAPHDVVQAGKVRYLGASSMWAWQFAALEDPYAPRQPTYF
jgi:hypothetical protein